MLVHQIWLGSHKRPDIWIDTIKNFCKKYDHEYILWDEYNMFELTNKKYYNMITPYCGKADIYRYEILYRYGGIYIDTDIVIINDDQFNDMIIKFKESSDIDIILGREPNAKYIANSIIFAKKKCSFLEKVISCIPSRDYTKNVFKIAGPLLITDVYKSIKTKEKSKIKILDAVVFFPVDWNYLSVREVDYHKKMIFSTESVTFQYGYSTNRLSDKIESATY